MLTVVCTVWTVFASEMRKLDLETGCRGLNISFCWKSSFAKHDTMIVVCNSQRNFDLQIVPGVCLLFWDRVFEMLLFLWVCVFGMYCIAESFFNLWDKINKYRYRNATCNLIRCIAFTSGLSLQVYFPPLHKWALLHKYSVTEL